MSQKTTKTTTAWSDPYKGMSASAAFEAMSEKASTGAACPEEVRYCVSFIANAMRMETAEAKQALASGAFDEKYGVSRLMRLWGWTKDHAKKVWSAIVRFFKAIGRGIKSVFTKKDKAEPKAAEQPENVKEEAPAAA